MSFTVTKTRPSASLCGHAAAVVDAVTCSLRATGSHTHTQSSRAALHHPFAFVCLCDDIDMSTRVDWGYTKGVYSRLAVLDSIRLYSFLGIHNTRKLGENELSLQNRADPCSYPRLSKPGELLFAAVKCQVARAWASCLAFPVLEKRMKERKKANVRVSASC
ncbi:hypothetical protein B0H66DRAFT_85297 [Apodospora peruviana]|uniref:Uncharacterized protein n=1 Tax=Apodospora peruviana TaxID=516989 RepID=A0AAE0MFV2_9PEZI|nr:hypothetical protein B0H66DRAFT_85297 [Apodospora peruviana]